MIISYFYILSTGIPLIVNDNKFNIFKTSRTNSFYANDFFKSNFQCAIVIFKWAANHIHNLKKVGPAVTHLQHDNCFETPLRWNAPRAVVATHM